jgi:tRNA A-37 threonylcarbamoyl transferase component Bud32
MATLQIIQSFYSVHVLPILVSVTVFFVKAVIKLNRTIRPDRDLKFFKSRKKNFFPPNENSLGVFIEEIGLTAEWNSPVYEEILNSPEYLLGEYDQDCYILSDLEPIHLGSTIDRDHFIPRKRFKIFLVSVYGRLGVKKVYSGDPVAFANELKIYARLSGKKINIPAILDVNFDRFSITFSYIRGPTLRERLHDIGAVISDHDIEKNPELSKLPHENRWLIQTENKYESLYSIIDLQFVENLFDEIKKIHDSDIYINDVKYGNIIIEAQSNKPFLIDFEESRDLRGFGRFVKKILKDHETDLFNSIFFTKKTN